MSMRFTCTPSFATSRGLSTDASGASPHGGLQPEPRSGPALPPYRCTRTKSEPSKESPWTAGGGAWIRRLPGQRWRGWREDRPSRGHGGGRSLETPAATALGAAPAGPRAPCEPATRRARVGCGGGSRDARPAPARAMRAHPQCGAGWGGGGNRTPCVSECVFQTPAARHGPRGAASGALENLCCIPPACAAGWFNSRCSCRAWSQPPGPIGAAGLLTRRRVASPWKGRVSFEFRRVPCCALFPDSTEFAMALREIWPQRRG